MSAAHDQLWNALSDVLRATDGSGTVSAVTKLGDALLPDERWERSMALVVAQAAELQNWLWGIRVSAMLDPTVGIYLGLAEDFDVATGAEWWPVHLGFSAAARAGDSSWPYTVDLDEGPTNPDVLRPIGDLWCDQAPATAVARWCLPLLTGGLALAGLRDSDGGRFGSRPIVVGHWSGDAIELDHIVPDAGP